jgi:hypothetical protein
MTFRNKENKKRKTADKDKGQKKQNDIKGKQHKLYKRMYIIPCY